MQGGLTWGMNAIVVAKEEVRVEVGQGWAGRYLFD